VSSKNFLKSQVHQVNKLSIILYIISNPFLKLVLMILIHFFISCWLSSNHLLIFCTVSTIHLLIPISLSKFQNQTSNLFLITVTACPILTWLSLKALLISLVADNKASLIILEVIFHSDHSFFNSPLLTPICFASISKIIGIHSANALNSCHCKIQDPNACDN
jgi:hypothetical protein